MSQVAELFSQRLLNDFQRDFPLTPDPYEQLARILGVSADDVMKELELLKSHGKISRIGPVFRPNTVGASTLAAMAVPADKIESVAEVINSFAQVNHNYEREHTYNLWFVVTDSNKDTLNTTLTTIEEKTGYKLMSLPLLKGYFIDLGFDLSKGSHENKVLDQGVKKDIKLPAYSELLIEVAQHGLPLTARPYADLGRQVGLTEQQVIKGLGDLIDAGVIKRLGVVVRHRKLGFQSNAMVVWDVPRDRIDIIGQQMGSQSCVNLCYQRPRLGEQWPYNLFCMIHGRNRDDVLECIDDMRKDMGIQNMSYDILFSQRCFKQRGAVYRHGPA